jgi:hypothetical protein
MNEDELLAAFAEDLRQSVLNRASCEGEEEFEGDAFTQTMIDHLVDAGELDDGQPCYYKARGIEVHGYHASDDGSVLDLFSCIRTGSVPPSTVSKTEVEATVKRLTGYLLRVCDGNHQQLEEASPAYDMTLRISEIRNDVSQIRFFLFTDGVTTVKTKVSDKWQGKRIVFHIWDIRRLFRCVSSGQQREPIEVNFVKDFGGPVPCLSVPPSGQDYRAYLAILRGDVLCKLYEEYGPRLLELNVRSFLQARGGVNKGIRETILKQPDRFLAYNNGISITANAVKIVTLPDGGKGIAWAKDLQIVNGGQTTASIYHSTKKDKADPSTVHVQAKFSIVDGDHMKELVPLISRYANSQNKINEADFSANAAFHVQLEELSRTTWAPAADGSQRQTKWFYERARGQYLDAKARESTPAKKREFESIWPTSQKFTKTDLAKFENTWAKLPYKVSFGAEKNFREFTLQIQDGAEPNVDKAYFQDVIAKAILFRRAEKIVQAEKFGGYRANIVTYSLAYLACRHASQIDLDRIWKSQDISAKIADAITRTCREIHAAIVDPPGGRNVTEWCKKEACWDRVRNLKIPF